jgi:hypothetical protein
MQPLVSSLSAGDCLVHWLRKKKFLYYDALPNQSSRSKLVFLSVDRLNTPDLKYKINLLKRRRKC